MIISRDWGYHDALFFSLDVFIIFYKLLKILVISFLNNYSIDGESTEYNGQLLSTPQRNSTKKKNEQV